MVDSEPKLVLVVPCGESSIISSVGPRAIEFLRASRDPETETGQKVLALSQRRKANTERCFGWYKARLLDMDLDQIHRDFALDQILMLQSEADLEDELDALPNEKEADRGRRAA